MLPTPKNTTERLLKAVADSVRGEFTDKITPSTNTDKLLKALGDKIIGIQPTKLPTPKTNTEHYLTDIVLNYSPGSDAPVVLKDAFKGYAPTSSLTGSYSFGTKYNCIGDFELHRLKVYVYVAGSATFVASTSNISVEVTKTLSVGENIVDVPVVKLTSGSELFIWIKSTSVVGYSYYKPMNPNTDMLTIKDNLWGTSNSAPTTLWNNDNHYSFVPIIREL